MSPRIAFFAAFAVMLSIASFERNTVWGDELMMWSDAVKKSPMRWKPHYKLAVLLFRNLPDGSLLEFTIALRLNPRLPDAYNNMGLIYQRKGLLDLAVKEYSTAIEMGLKGGTAQVNMGTVYLRRGDLSGALKWFLSALERDPSDTEAMINAGFTYGDMGEYNKAIGMHERALSVNPYRYNARYGLAIAHEAMGEFEKAAYDWREYLKDAPPDALWRPEAEERLKRLIQR